MSVNFCFDRQPETGGLLPYFKGVLPPGKGIADIGAHAVMFHDNYPDMRVVGPAITDPGLKALFVAMVGAAKVFSEAAEEYDSFKAAEIAAGQDKFLTGEFEERVDIPRRRELQHAVGAAEDMLRGLFLVFVEYQETCSLSSDGFALLGRAIAGLVVDPTVKPKEDRLISDRPPGLVRRR